MEQNKDVIRNFLNDNAAIKLLQLLSIAINRKSFILDDNVDWRNVLILAQKQGVRGVVYEALELLKQEDKTCTCFPDRTTLMQWYAQTVFVEKKIAQHVDWAKDVVRLWKQHGIKTIVFKGLAHSRYYPRAEHREFGDFDCYLIDAYGNCAYRQGNEIARKKGLTVDDGWYKHSHIAYKKLTIENHQFFTSVRRGGTDKTLHQYMVEAIGNGSPLERLDDSL